MTEIAKKPKTFTEVPQPARRHLQSRPSRLVGWFHCESRQFAIVCGPSRNRYLTPMHHAMPIPSDRNPATHVAADFVSMRSNEHHTVLMHPLLSTKSFLQVATCLEWTPSSRPQASNPAKSSPSRAFPASWSACSRAGLRSSSARATICDGTCRPFSFLEDLVIAAPRLLDARCTGVVNWLQISNIYRLQGQPQHACSYFLQVLSVLGRETRGYEVRCLVSEPQD